MPDALPGHPPASVPSRPQRPLNRWPGRPRGTAPFEDRIRTRPIPSPGPTLSAIRSDCQRCGEAASLLYPCLGRRLCFGCLTSVTRLTNGYESLRDMTRADFGSAIAQLSHADRHERTSGLCIRCLSDGGTVPGPTGELCTACSLALVAG